MVGEPELIESLNPWNDLPVQPMLRGGSVLSLPAAVCSSAQTKPAFLAALEQK